MKKILLTCFLALPCLFQKAIIKLKAIKERLRLPGPPIALRCIESLTYLAAGVFHVAQRSVSRGAYLSVAIFHRPQGGIFRAAYLYKKATWIGIYFFVPILLCSSISPTLRKVAQSPPESPLHRSAVPVSPHSGDTHRGEETLSDTFTQVDDGAEVSSPANYTTSLTTLDGGPMLRTLVLSTSPTRVGKFEPSDFGYRTSLPSSVSRLPSLTNFGLINPDQDMGAGEGTSSLQPAPVTVLPNGQFNSGREALSQSTEAQSLVSNVLCLESRNGLVDSDQDNEEGKEASNFHSSSVPVFKNHDNSDREAYSRSTEAQSLVSNVLCLESSNGLVDLDQDMDAGEEGIFLQRAPVSVFPSKNETASLRISVGRYDPLHRSSDIRHRTSLPSPVSSAERSRSMRLASSSNLLDTIPESTNQAVLYIELDGGPAEASYQTHLWKRVGAQGLEIASAQTIIQDVSPRDFHRGMMPSSSGALDIHTGPLENPTYLGVSVGETMILKPYLVYPGDSVLIRLNQQKGTVQFSGPDKKYFLLQHLLRLALENEGFTVHQVLSVSDKTKYLNSNSNRQKIEEAKDRFGRSVKVVQQGDEELNWLMEQFQKSDFPLRVRKLLYAHQEIISEDKLEKLQADVLGSYYTTYAKQLKRIIPDLSAEAVPQANRFLSELQRSLEAIQQDNWGLSGVVEFWLALSDAQMEIQSLDPLAWISGLPAGYPRDLLVEHYFLSKGELLKNLDEELEVGLSMVDDASVLATLSQIKATRSLGTPVLPIALLTSENDTVDLAGYKDQVLLVEFWLSGCGACLTRYQRVIKPLEDHFSKDSRFRMLAVSVDRNSDRWRSNIGTYSSQEATNALALPSAFSGLRQYGIDSYPAFLLLGKNGQILRVSGFPNQLDQLINLVQHALDTEFSTHPQTSQRQ